jgi:DUF971 family protein
MNRIVPVSIRLKQEQQLEITWSDGLVCRYGMPLLRRSCPCATCLEEKKNKGPFYIPLFAGDMLTLENITQQGHYAIQLFWKDGHHTGIFDFTYLRSLCPDAGGQGGQTA